MAKNQVTVEIGAKDTGEMERILGRQQREIDALKGKLAGMGKQGRDSFSDLARSAVAAVAGFVSIQQAAQLAGAEIQKLRDLQTAAAQAQIGVNTNRQDLLLNMVSETKESKKQVLEFIEKLSKDTKVAQPAITGAMTAAYSSTGGNLPLAMAAVERSASAMAHKPEAMPMFAGSLADMAKVTGSKDMNQNLGFLLQVGAMSRLTDPTIQASNIPRALVGARGFGATSSQAAALFAAITTQAADIEGRESGTGMIQLGKQLEEFIGGNMTMGQRIEKLQADPKLSKRFFEGGGRDALKKKWGGASFESKVLAPIRDLILNPQGATAQEYRKNLEVFPSLDVLGQKATQADRDRLIDPSEQIAQTGRMFDQSIEDMRLSDPKVAMAATVRKGIAEALDASGQGYLAGKIRGIEFDATTAMGTEDLKKQASKMIRERAKELGPRPKYYDPAGGGYGPSGLAKQEMIQPEADKKMQEILNRLAEAIEKMDTKSGAEVAKEIKELNSKTSQKSPTLTTHPQEDK